MPRGIYKRTKEHGHQISLALKGKKKPKGFAVGKNNSFYGKTHNEETRRKISETHKGRKLSQAHIDKIVTANKGKKRTTRSLEWSLKISQTLKGKLAGDKNPNWKGGKTSLGVSLRCGAKYKIWRNLIFLRDNFTCSGCSQHGGDLEAHHILSFSKIMDKFNIKTLLDAERCAELWDINNGTTYCGPCHSENDNFRRMKKCQNVVG